SSILSYAFDSVNNRLMVAGGDASGTGLASNAVWVLAGANDTASTPAWSNLIAENPSGPPPNFAGRPAAFDPVTGSMILVGDGRDGTTSLDAWLVKNANDMSSPSSWTQLLPTGGPPPASEGAQGAAYDPASNRLIVFFGVIENSIVSNQVWVLTDANGAPEACHQPQGAWSTQSPLLAAHGGAATGVVNGKIYIASGIGASTDVEAFDPATNMWSQVAPFPAADGAAYALGAGVGGKFYVIGGCTTNADCRIGTTANMEIYDSITNSWSSGP